MRTTLKLAFWLLLCIQPVFATNYTVKATGGGSFTTIQACANVTVAGDTCTVFGTPSIASGTYNETPNISRSGTGTNGTCTACITYNVNPGDTVTTYPWNIGADNIVMSGFTVTDLNARTSLVFNCNGLTPCHGGVYILGGHTNVQILNNTITQVGFATSGQTSSGYPCVSMQDGQSHYVTIKGNVLSWCSALAQQVNQVANCASNLGNCHMATGIVVFGDHILVQGNNISHFTNADTLGGLSSQVAFIGNTWGPTYTGAVDGTPPQHDSLGCLETNQCDTHVDMVEHVAGQNQTGDSQIIFEGNTAQKIWGTQGAHVFFASAGSGTLPTQWISRFNKAYQIGSVYLANAVSTANPNGVSSWKDYNNDYIQSQQQTTNQNFSGCNSANSNNGSFLNNIFYNDVNPAGSTGWSYYLWTGTSCLTNFSSGHNLFFDSACGANSLAVCTSGQTSLDPGNKWADPKLIATDGTNFGLQSNSPAIGAGTNLTTVAATDTGTGTSLMLNDAGYFTDGFQIPGLVGDCISIGTVSNHVCIVAVNLATNTLTLANSITRSPGQPVYLFSNATGTQVLFAQGPDIGAVPFGSTLAPPTNLQGTPTTISTDNWLDELLDYASLVR